MSADWLKRAVVAIGWLTALSGLFQLALPGFVLAALHAEVSPATAHFFAIVGMFMALFGGLLAVSVNAADALARGPLFWCGLQKVGASAAVGIGVGRGVFALVALGVAAFDFLSAVAIFAYRKRLTS